jgi:hypothetical protein
MYTQHIQGLLPFQAEYSRSRPIISSSCYNSSLVTWTVVCLIAAKLYFLCRCSPCQMLLTFEFSWFCMTSACSLHNFAIYVVIHVRQVKSHVHFSNGCAPWKMSSDAENSFCRRRSFSTWLSVANSQTRQSWVIILLMSAFCRASLMLVLNRSLFFITTLHGPN